MIILKYFLQIVVTKLDRVFTIVKDASEQVTHFMLTLTTDAEDKLK